MIKAASWMLVWVVLAIGWVIPAHAQTGTPYDIAPPQSWVREVAFDAQTMPPEEFASRGKYTRLYSEQMNLLGKEKQVYHREVYTLLNRYGIKAHTQIQIQFNPLFERVRLHHVHVTSAGRTYSQLDPSRLQLLGSSAQDLMLQLVLLNTEPGDVVDFAYTIEGENPEFKGMFFRKMHAQLDEPVEKVDIRLLWPKDKPLYVRSLRGAVDAKVMETDASKVYHWEFPARLPYIEPDRTPGWFTARPEIEVTEFASWHDYARWEMQHYNTQGQLNEAVKAIAAEIAAKSTTPEEKMLHALHYVQQKAVYGESAYYVLPRTPAQTLARGFGDCKDKTFLLLALLEALGIKAHAVAANVEGLHRLEASLPMPWHFNHVLAYVELEGTSYWLDSTQPPTATLSELESGDKGDVLILAENTHAPMTMPLPLPDAPLHAKWEVYDATKGFEQPVKLEVKEIFTGAAARYFRARLAAVGIQEIAQQRLAEYAARYEGAMRDGAPFLQDSLGRNSVTMIDRYLIPAPMEANATKPKPFYLHHAELNGGLQRPEAQQRQVPYAVYYPYYRQHRVQLALPEGYTAADRFAEEAKMVEHPAFHAEYRQYKKAGQWVMTSEVKFLQASVKAEAFEAFQQAAQEWDQATPATTIVPTSNSVEGGVNWWAKGWVGFLLLAVIALGWFTVRKHATV